MIRAHPLTPTQFKALDSQRNIAVTASAGSGKTATLVERYIDLLRTNPDIGVRQVLAITFTQKAAAEMKERVAARLEQATSAAEDLQEQRQLNAIHEDLLNARISTIHAFCAALLREYPIEAEVDPHFAVLEEVEATIRRREAVSETLEALAQRPEGDPVKGDLRRLLQDWERSYLEHVLHALILKKRLALEWANRYRAMSREELVASWQQHLDHLLDPLCHSLLEKGKLLPLLDRLGTLAPLKNAAKDTAGQLLAPVREDIKTLIEQPSLKKARDILPRLARALTTSDGRPYKSNKGNKANWNPDDLSSFRQTLSAVGALFAPRYEDLTRTLGARDLRAAELTLALCQVFIQVCDRYERKKGRGALLDFDDLQEQCLRLMHRDEGRLGRRLAQHYRYIMVDEFQDTDLLQWELIRPLVSVDGELDCDKLFIVGDPKQSIYSFRDADVTVFEHIKQNIVQANTRYERHKIPFHDDNGTTMESRSDERDGALIMGENFRTLPAPVEFVNMLFEQLMQPVEDEPFQVSYEPSTCQRPHLAGQGSVELLLAPVQEDEEEQDSIQREADLMARRIRHILDDGDLQIAADDTVRPATAADMAILLRRRRFLPLYEQALRSLHIPFQAVGGLGFYQRQEIYDLANILRTLDNPYDNVALLGALRSPYLGLSDNALFALSQLEGNRLGEKLGNAPAGALPLPDQRAARDAVELLQHWNDLKDRLSLVDLLHTILEDTGAWGFLGFGERGEQTIANVEKFLDLARGFGAAGFSPLSDFVDHLNVLIDQSDKEGEAHLPPAQGRAVQILTVHAAKGLEFPVVFVPDMDGRFNLQQSAAVLLDRDHGIGLSVPDPEEDFRRRPSFVRQLIGRNYQRRALAEEKRLFYVATTRARDHLLLCGRLDEKHLTQRGSFEEARDRLSWTCQGLDLKAEDLERGEKTFEHNGRPIAVRIFTDLEQIPAHRPPADPGPRAYTALWNSLPERDGNGPDSTTELPAELQALRPLETPVALQSFSATQLMLFEESPASYFERYVLGLPETGRSKDAPVGEVEEQRLQFLLFGELAHAALEEISLDPDQDREACVDRILLEAALPDQDLRRRFQSDLLDLMARFEGSAFGQALQADSAARLEQSFTLRH